MRTARQHNQSSIPNETSFELPWWRPRLQDEDQTTCMHCGGMTEDYYDPGLWHLQFSEFEKIHKEQMDSGFYGLPVNDPSAHLEGSISARKTCLHICDECGWWIAEDRAVLPSKGGQIWVVTLSSMSVLQELNLADIEAPVQEVRRYLRRKFETRSTMHPRLWELTVASVFRDVGYTATATAYSRDGGIDVVLEKGIDGPIGVQVKRQKGVIEVDQIRAFLGALTLGGYARGVFVSTSRFSEGATKAAALCAQRHVPIDLVDANRFFDMLGYTRIEDTLTPDNCGICPENPLNFYYESYYYLNSL